MTEPIETISSQALLTTNFDFEILPGEVWREVDGATKYAISNLGRAASSSRSRYELASRSSPKMRLLKPSVRNPEKGYLTVSIGYDDGRRRLEVLHRLVALAFVRNPDPENWDTVRHKVAVSAGGSNHADNLEWGTQAMNIQDAIRDGTMPRGQRNGNSKFSDDDVREIRRLASSGVPIRALARSYGVYQGAIQYIVRGKSYAHVK